MAEIEAVSSSESPWEEYYRRSEHFEIRPTLEYAIQRFEEEGVRAGLAVDLCCGAGHETKNLAERGWRVIAVDADSAAEKYLFSRGILGDWHFVCSRMERFLFPYKTTLINSSYGMPFCPKDELGALVARISEALIKGGRFAGQFFGPRDSWSNKPHMSFVTKEEIESMFQGFEIEWLEELEYDKAPTVGDFKHWHLFHLVAKKL